MLQGITRTPRSLRATGINLWTRTASHKVLFAQLNFRTQSGFAGLEVAEALQASWSAAKLWQKFLFSSVIYFTAIQLRQVGLDRQAHSE